MADPKTTEAAFRDSLADAAALIDKLMPFCQTTAELLEAVELATKNDGQLRILLDLVAKKR